MPDIELVGLGALNMDHIYQVERILEDGETVVKWAGLFPGGSAANTVYGLAKLGISTGFIGAVGDDAEGKLLLKDLKKTGVHTAQIKVKSKAKSGLALCISDRHNNRSIYIMPGANDRLAIEDVDLDYINRARWLHIASFAGDRQFKLLLRLMARLDFAGKISFAPGALFSRKGLKALSPILARTHVLFINESEIRQLTGKDDIREAAEICVRQGCRLVVITLGKGTSKGFAEYRHSEETVTAYVVGAKKRDVVTANITDIVASASTVGAGDAFAAGFLYGLLKNKSISECGRLANIVAQGCVARTGARQGLPTLNQLARRYRAIYHHAL